MKVEHLSEFSSRMRLSGYGESFRAQILSGGITGYLKKMALCTNKEIPFNRHKAEIMDSKKRKKDGSSWFRRRDQDASFKSVLFVPYTPGSELVGKIRDLEACNRQGRETRIKVVEQAGRTLLNSFSNNYQWKPRACEDQNLTTLVGPDCLAVVKAINLIKQGKHSSNPRL